MAMKLTKDMKLSIANLLSGRITELERLREDARKNQLKRFGKVIYTRQIEETYWESYNTICALKESWKEIDWKFTSLSRFMFDSIPAEFRLREFTTQSSEYQDLINAS